MILEHAILNVRAGEAEAFLEAFAQASPIIESQRGCRSLRLERCVEDPDKFLLLVEWGTLEDHTEGFRRSPEYQRWRELLHKFYDPFPVVEHFTTAHSTTAPS